MWNGHVGRAGTGYREVHGGMGYGWPEPDVEGERILEYALAFDLLLGNTCFKKGDSHLTTYRSGNAARQIDFILFCRTMRRLVTDVKVIPGEEIAQQHQLLICDMRINVPPKSKRWRCETWWWTEHVEKVIASKMQAFKAWKTGKGTRASYNEAKRIARHAVHHARQEADKAVYENIDPKSSEIYGLTNQLRRENADVVGDKPVKNDAGEMSLSKDSKQKAWLEHYQRLLNIEFDWDPDHLSDEPTVEGLPITTDMVKKAISKRRADKAAGPSGIVVEMIRAAGDKGVPMIHDLTAAIIRGGKVPSDWEQSFIICLYKGKGDALERANYRGLKLTELVMKVLERIVDGLIRQLVSIDYSQFGFVPGRGNTDAIFVVRLLQERHLAANKRIYMAFVDLEKAFDRVPQNVIWWALRKLGVQEWIVRLVHGLYANTQSRVHVCEGYSEEFEVKVGVHQGSVLSPLLFIIVLEALSYEFHPGVPREDLYADYLVIIAGSLKECVGRLLIWKKAMEEKGLRVNAGKTKVVIFGTGLDLLQSSAEFPCGVCHT